MIIKILAVLGIVFILFCVWTAFAVFAASGDYESDPEEDVEQAAYLEEKKRENQLTPGLKNALNKIRSAEVGRLIENDS